MSAPDRMTSNVYLAPSHLNHIRATIDWQAMFTGLSLKRDNQKSKPDDWWAYSPFKEERSASFHMGPNGIWYDFSVGMGGGPIELIQRLHSYNCYEAANYILEQGWAQSALTVRAQQDTVKSKVQKISKPDFKNDPIRQDLLPMCSYHDYLAERGISEETCSALGIGYLPQGRSPLRGRVIFQIRDARINNTDERERVTLSHMGRAIDNKTKPKYLFYEGFHKSSELYGQDVIWTDPEAKRQIRETGHIVLTEGPFDVAKAYEAGLRNVVASFGANLSKRQKETLDSMCKSFAITKVLIIYDRDKAGKDGTQKTVQWLKDRNLNVTVFGWETQFCIKNRKISIPSNISDLADMKTKQINWLRAQSLL